MENILLTGPPGIGKTSIVKKVVEAAREIFGGFYTEEIREKKERVGFRIRTLDGKVGILAHVKFQSKYRVGRYGVKLEDLEDIAVRSIHEAIVNKRVIVIDELGKMELYSTKFKEQIIRALDSGRKVLATIKGGRNEFLDRIKKREDVLLIPVTRQNRDELPRRVLEILTRGH